MKKAPPKPPQKSAGKARRIPHLDDDEVDLWSMAAETIEPLKRNKARFHAASERSKTEPMPPRATPSSGGAPPSTSAKIMKPAATRSSPPAVPHPKVNQPSAPPIADFDRRKVRKIRSGQVDIEARIDLHGMRQDEAHTALRAFLIRCLGKGQRWVLVITGKGKASDRDADAPFDMTVQRDRGVLKRNVPRWLAEPDLRPLVVSYTTAAIHHGGEGAIYVHLRTKRHQR